MLESYAVPKPKRRRRSRGNADFSQTTRKAIIERDNGLCVFCGKKYEHIHHIIFKSAGGLGTVDNGCCVCRQCHEWAHSGRKGRKWFEWWMEKKRRYGETEPRVGW